MKYLKHGLHQLQMQAGSSNLMLTQQNSAPGSTTTTFDSVSKLFRFQSTNIGANTVLS